MERKSAVCCCSCSVLRPTGHLHRGSCNLLHASVTCLYCCRYCWGTRVFALVLRVVPACQHGLQLQPYAGQTFHPVLHHKQLPSADRLHHTGDTGVNTAAGAHLCLFAIHTDSVDLQVEAVKANTGLSGWHQHQQLGVPDRQQIQYVFRFHLL